MSENSQLRKDNKTHHNKKNGAPSSVLKKTKSVPNIGQPKKKSKSGPLPFNDAQDKELSFKSFFGSKSRNSKSIFDVSSENSLSESVNMNKDYSQSNKSLRKLFSEPAGASLEDKGSKHTSILKKISLRLSGSKKSMKQRLRGKSSSNTDRDEEPRNDENLDGNKSVNKNKQNGDIDLENDETEAESVQVTSGFVRHRKGQMSMRKAFGIFEEYGAHEGNIPNKIELESEQYDEEKHTTIPRNRDSTIYFESGDVIEEGVKSDKIFKAETKSASLFRNKNETEDTTSRAHLQRFSLEFSNQRDSDINSTLKPDHYAHQLREQARRLSFSKAAGLNVAKKQTKHDIQNYLDPNTSRTSIYDQELPSHENLYDPETQHLQQESSQQIKNRNSYIHRNENIDLIHGGHFSQDTSNHLVPHDVVSNVKSVVNTPNILVGHLESQSFKTDELYNGSQSGCFAEISGMSRDMSFNEPEGSDDNQAFHRSIYQPKQNKHLFQSEPQIHDQMKAAYKSKQPDDLEHPIFGDSRCNKQHYVDLNVNQYKIRGIQNTNKSLEEDVERDCSASHEISHERKPTRNKISNFDQKLNESDEYEVRGCKTTSNLKFIPVFNKDSIHLNNSVSTFPLEVHARHDRNDCNECDDRKNDDINESILLKTNHVLSNKPSFLSKTFAPVAFRPNLSSTAGSHDDNVGNQTFLTSSDKLDIFTNSSNTGHLRTFSDSMSNVSIPVRRQPNEVQGYLSQRSEIPKISNINKFKFESFDSSPSDGFTQPNSVIVRKQIRSMSVSIERSRLVGTDEEKGRVTKRESVEKRKKCGEEVDCDEFAWMLANKLSLFDPHLSNVLMTKHKTALDYVPSLTNVRYCPKGDDRDALSNDDLNTNPKQEDLSVTSDSKSKNCFVTLEQEKIDMENKLVKKLDALCQEKKSVQTGIAENEYVGKEVLVELSQHMDNKQVGKFQSLVLELEKVMKLILKLSNMLARTEASYTNLPHNSTDKEKAVLHNKSESLKSKLNDARSIKENVNNKYDLLLSLFHASLPSNLIMNLDNFFSQKSILMLEFEDLESEMSLVQTQLQSLRCTMNRNSVGTCC